MLRVGYSLVRRASAKNAIRAAKNARLIRSVKVAANEANNHAEWEESYTEIIESQQGNAGNAGQETLLGDDYFIPVAIDYCAGVSRSYDSADFVNHVQETLGDYYYDAISEIVGSCAEELEAANADIFSLTDLFSSVFASNRVYRSERAALQAYSYTAGRKFGASWNTPAASSARSAATATRFLAANPNGTSRTTLATPYASRTTTQRASVGSRTATRFLAANPNGTRRESVITPGYRATAARNGKPLPP